MKKATNREPLEALRGAGSSGIFLHNTKTRFFTSRGFIGVEVLFSFRERKIFLKNG